jgi:hypothetical protein
MYSVYILYVLYVSVCICTYHESRISLPGGTAGWLWNLRPESRTLRHFDTRLPIYLAARAQANAHYRLRTANGCQDPTSQTRLNARLTPPWTDFPTTQGCQYLTAPALWKGHESKGRGSHD